MESYCPQKKKSLSRTFDLSGEICLWTISLISGPYDSRKLKGRAKRSSRRKGRMAETRSGSLASALLLLWVPAGSNQGGFGGVNHCLQALNSQGRRRDESGACALTSRGGIAATLGAESCCSSLTLVLKRWNSLKPDSARSPWWPQPLTLNEVIYAADVGAVAG